MKIAILTYHNTRNCGALLQAYALQKTLFDIGIDNDILDYRCPKIEETYIIKKIYEIKTAKEIIKWLLTIKSVKISQKKFDEFRKQYLKMSEVYVGDTILKANKSYDGFITGSDQVWNFNLNENDYTYLLDFVSDDKTRLSFAASIGNKNISEENKKKFADELLRFNDISVREKDLKEYVDDILDVESKLVLDPTLLLNKEEYNFNESQRIIDKKYIFVYTIASTPNIENAAKILSQKTGYPIIWGHMSCRRKKGVINKTDISPDEFINYIRNAEYVLTSSFHGMALSIVMEKQFFYDLDLKKQNNNSRLENLAEILELQERELSAFKDICLENIINYDIVKRRLILEKEKSINFLKINLKK